MIVRREQPGDEAAISNVVASAFGRADEAALVERLRAAGDAVVSLVAVADRSVARRVMFSRMTAPFRASGLAPVAVAPGLQRAGIGRSLVAEGLDEARRQGLPIASGRVDYAPAFEALP